MRRSPLIGFVSIESIFVTSPNWDDDDQYSRQWQGKDPGLRDCYSGSVSRRRRSIGCDTLKAGTSEQNSLHAMTPAAKMLKFTLAWIDGQSGGDTPKSTQDYGTDFT